MRAPPHQIYFGLWLMVSSCAPAETTQRDSSAELAATSEPAGKALFNGHNLDNWMVKIHYHAVGENYGDTFRAEDGMIKVRYDGYGDFDEQYGHLHYRQPYAYFHLKLEYRFVGELQVGAPEFTRLNSGVMFHAQDSHTMPEGSALSEGYIALQSEGQPIDFRNIKLLDLSSRYRAAGQVNN